MNTYIYVYIYNIAGFGAKFLHSRVRQSNGLRKGICNGDIDSIFSYRCQLFGSE